MSNDALSGTKERKKSSEIKLMMLMVADGLRFTVALPAITALPAAWTVTVVVDAIARLPYWSCNCTCTVNIVPAIPGDILGKKAACTPTPAAKLAVKASPIVRPVAKLSSSVIVACSRLVTSSIRMPMLLIMVTACVLSAAVPLLTTFALIVVLVGFAVLPKASIARIRNVCTASTLVDCLKSSTTAF